jgi:GNAT superfamily N-acetyltransferase
VTPAATPLRIEPATPERWTDLEALFGPNGAFANCWCTWWRWRAAAWDRAGKDERRADLRARVAGGEEPGLLAYDGDEPIGWCAIAPRHGYARLTSPRARTYRPLDDRPSWVVTCFFVLPGQRRRGVAAALLDAVAGFVAERGGTLVEGYPVEGDDHSPAAIYTGTAGMFRRAGFVEVARTGARPLVRLELPSRRSSFTRPEPG